MVSSSSKTAPAGKRRLVSIGEKLDIIAAALSHQRFTVIAARHKMSLSSVYNIVRLRDEVFAAAQLAVDSADRHADLFCNFIARDSTKRRTADQKRIFEKFNELCDQSAQPLSTKDVVDHFGISTAEAHKLFEMRRQYRRSPETCVEVQEATPSPPVVSIAVAEPYTKEQILNAIRICTEKPSKSKLPEMTLNDPDFVPLTTSLWNFKNKLPTVCMD